MKQHLTPCRECPFRRASAPGYLGASTPAEFIATSEAEVLMPCHLHIDYEDEDWQETVPDAPQCAGRAIHFKNRGKLPRDPDIAAVVRQVEKSPDVFTFPAEFLAHHGAKA